MSGHCRGIAVTVVALVLLAYLIGSVSFAVVVSRALGLPDPRAYGSRNPGATNVLRTGSRAAAAATLAGDSAKGWLAVVAAQRLSEPGAVEATMALAAVAVVLGHMYPLFHGLRGGKGVATALGVLLGLEPYLALAAAAVWVLVALWFRYSSLAALAAALAAPGLCYLFFGLHPFTAAVGAVALLLVARHRSNIRNLLSGTENRIGGGAR